MLCLICKCYLNITFLPGSSINRFLYFTYVQYASGFLSRLFYLILRLTICNTRFVFFVLFRFFISVQYLLKKKMIKKNKSLISQLISIANPTINLDRKSISRFPYDGNFALKVACVVKIKFFLWTDFIII